MAELEIWCGRFCRTAAVLCFSLVNKEIQHREDNDFGFSFSYKYAEMTQNRTELYLYGNEVSVSFIRKRL